MRALDPSDYKKDAMLSGARILIVEDDMMIAMLLEDMLGELGCHVIGPANTLATALAAASDETIHAAILDVNLGAESAFPVADVLRARGVPIIFSTGYGDAGLRDQDRSALVLGKPYRAEDLSAALNTALART